MKKMLALLLTFSIVQYGLIFGQIFGGGGTFFASALAETDVEEFELSSMTLEQLNQLKAAIDDEIRINHTPDNVGKEAILDATKDIVEKAFADRGITVSWAWVDYKYTKDWDSYTLATHIDYYDASSTKVKPDVYAEGNVVDGICNLTFVQVGDEVLLSPSSTVPNTTTGTEEATESQQEEAISLQYGELLSLHEQDGIAVVKAKIAPSFSNSTTVSQNYYNIEALVKKHGFDKYDEVQYWAVADMTDGSEQKVISFTVPHDVLTKIAAGKLAINQLGSYVTDLWVHQSLR